MEIGVVGFALIVGLALIWFWNSIYIIKEWERGVVLRLGRLLPEAKTAGINLVLWPIEPSTASTCELKRWTSPRKTSSRATMSL